MSQDNAKRTVYVAYLSWPYEGGKLLGVYTTEEQARSVAEAADRAGAEVVAMEIDAPPIDGCWV